ncbi:MAG: hypothetical protein RIC03_12420 [Cyclobacteriaceae bacterium]
MLSVESIEELKKKLPKGYYKELLRKTELSVGTLNSFLNGKAYRLDIHRIILEMIEQYERDKQELINRTRKIIK